MPTIAAPNGRNQPELTANPEYVELYKKAKACGDRFPATLKSVPTGMEERFKECVKILEEFIVSSHQSDNSVEKRGVDGSIAGGVLGNAIDHNIALQEGWEKVERKSVSTVELPSKKETKIFVAAKADIAGEE